MFTFRNPRVRSLTKKGTGTFGLSISKRWSNNLFIVSLHQSLGYFLPLLVLPGNSDSIASRAAKKARTVRACRQMASFLSRNDVLHDTNPNPGLLANCCQQLRGKGKVTKVMQSKAVKLAVKGFQMRDSLRRSFLWKKATRRFFHSSTLYLLYEPLLSFSCKVCSTYQPSFPFASYTMLELFHFRTEPFSASGRAESMYT